MTLQLHQVQDVVFMISSNYRQSDVLKLKIITEEFIIGKIFFQTPITPFYSYAMSLCN